MLREQAPSLFLTRQIPSGNQLSWKEGQGATLVWRSIVPCSLFCPVSALLLAAGARPQAGQPLWPRRCVCAAHQGVGVLLLCLERETNSLCFLPRTQGEDVRVSPAWQMLLVSLNALLASCGNPDWPGSLKTCVGCDGCANGAPGEGRLPRVKSALFVCTYRDPSHELDA